MMNLPWSWWNAREIKLAEKTAVLGHTALTLEDLHESTSQIALLPYLSQTN
jgi:hypothetical protein